MKTREEVEELKKQWLKDMTWDLSSSEGFEEYEPELAAFEDATRESKYKAAIKELFNLKIGDGIRINGSFFVAVPGGWVYETVQLDNMHSSIACCFIPHPAHIVKQKILEGDESQLGYFNES